MGKEIFLNVNGRKVKTVDITYKDLIWLYQDFEKKHGHLPTTNDGKSKYNMPQQRIIKRVLEKNNITFNDFMNSLGKIKHVRTESKDYIKFVKRYIEVSNKIGHPLMQRELMNNTYGLPSSMWFIKNNPDNVNGFNDFVLWCGFDSNKLKNETNDVTVKLIELEKKLGRPIIHSDITVENVGFTPIVINRIWGGIYNCKRELGLLDTPKSQPKPFEYYSSELLKILNRIKKESERTFASWADIENKKYNPYSIEHKTFTQSFKREGIDIYAFIKKNGFHMNPNKFSFHYTFDSGERVVSSYEYDFTYFLNNEINMKYNEDYNRDVLYNTFSDHNKKSKINCDYAINVNGCIKYIEIAGLIHNGKNDWDTHFYKCKRDSDYQEKMIIKRNIFERNNKDYLFLFPEDFRSDRYKEKFKKFINIIHNKEVA